MPLGDKNGRLFYHRLPDFARKQEKLDFLSANTLDTVNWQRLSPNQKNTWLRSDTEDEFDAYLPIGSKEAKRAKPDNAETIFKTYCRGVATSRDMYVYDFSYDPLVKRTRRFVEDYNAQVDKYNRQTPKPNIDDFVDYDKIAWSRDLKLDLKRGNYARYIPNKIRASLYRPFARKRLFLDRILNEEVYQQLSFFPDEQAEAENRLICCTDVAYRSQSVSALILDSIPNLSICATTDGHQCFPFYTYDEDGSNRRDNITDYALDQFRAHYNDPAISKWDIFYYVYGLLHHPGYRERYALDLKRNLPRIPFVPDPHPKPLPHKEVRASTSIEKWDIPPELEQRMQAVARELRKNPTDAEDKLWQSIRNKQLDGRKFRRQVAIGAFIVDFYCASEHLVVEVDGPIHESRREADQARQQLIESLGIRFVRFTNDQVANHLQHALEKIRAAYLPDSNDVSSPSLILGNIPREAGDRGGAGAGGWGQNSAFHAFSRAGKQLADLHLNYEFIERHELDWQAERTPISYRVEKMLPKGKTDSEHGNYKVFSSLKYNDSLTLHGIPERAFAYRLGNRSALEWIIDQYRVKTDKRSGITHDPNGYSDDEKYILHLIERIITVSLRTVDIVEQLANLPFREIS